MRFALIVNDESAPTPADGVWADRITAAGHTPEYVTAGVADFAARIGDCSAAITTGSVSQSVLGTSLRTWPFPVCLCAGATGNPWATNGLTDVTTSSSSTTNIWTMTTPSDPLHAGRTGTQAPWGATGTTRHITGAVAGSVPLAYVNAGATRWAYFYVPAGTELAGGGTAPALRIAIAGDNTGVATPSAAYTAWQDAIISALATSAPPPPADSVPTVSATASPPTSTGGTFTLLGSETLAPGASEVTSRSWTAVTSGAPALTGASTATATGTAATPGVYVYAYRATNAAGESAPAEASVTVLAVTSRTQFWDGNSYEPRRRHVYRGAAGYLDLSDASTGAWPPV